MPRLVVHAGFHKTGTTSVQAMLRENADRLAPHLRIFLKPDFEPLTRAARAFTLAPEAATLAGVSEKARAFFDSLDADDARCVVMASEDLAGHMPGRHGRDSYDGAGLLMAAIAKAATRIATQEETIFFFSTRNREDWLRSTWWQSLRSTRLCEDFDTYRARLYGAPDLDASLAEIASDVAPATVISRRLEDSARTRLGPLTPLLDAAGVPATVRHRLTALPPENVRPDLGIDAVFLALNRSGLPDAQISDLKREIRRRARIAARH